MKKSFDWGQNLSVLFFAVCCALLTIATIRMIKYDAPDTLATVLSIACSAAFAVVTVHSMYMTVQQFRNRERWRKRSIRE